MSRACPNLPDPIRGWQGYEAAENHPVELESVANRPAGKEWQQLKVALKQSRSRCIESDLLRLSAKAAPS